MRYRLNLKEYGFSDPEGARIYDLTKKNVENFNGYVDDFYESVSIIRHNMELLAGDNEKKITLGRDIDYIENKISELSAAMKQMADDMPFLIELQLVEKD